MAGMAVACGTKAAMAPAGGLRSGSRIEARGAAAGAAAAGAVASGLGRMSLRHRLQLSRVVVSSPRDAKRFVTNVTQQTEIADTEVTEVQATGSEAQVVIDDVLKQVKETWANVDDKVAIGGLGVIALIALWGSSGLISSIEKLPLIPQLLELVGLLYTGWFIYRYLLFKPDREELLKVVDEIKAKVTGQDDL